MYTPETVWYRCGYMNVVRTVWSKTRFWLPLSIGGLLEQSGTIAYFFLLLHEKTA
jgi:hypothetical protein